MRSEADKNALAGLNEQYDHQRDWSQLRPQPPEKPLTPEEKIAAQVRKAMKPRGGNSDDFMQHPASNQVLPEDLAAFSKLHKIL